MTEKVKLWKWFVRGAATSHFPSRLVIVREGGRFAHAVALTPNAADGVENFTIYDSEESLRADYSETPMIREISYYTRARQSVEDADRARGLLNAGA